MIYLAYTRPDIGFDVGMVSRFMNAPTNRYMEVVFQILHYLKRNPGYGLYFKKTGERGVKVYTDADLGGYVMDGWSTTGYFTFVRGNIVTWRSKKQSVVSKSSDEAEFQAMCQGICEGICPKRMLKELKIPNNQRMTLLSDNSAAIEIAKNSVHHDRTKHMDINRNFIKEKLEARIFELSYVPSEF